MQHALNLIREVGLHFGRFLEAVGRFFHKSISDFRQDLHPGHRRPGIDFTKLHFGLKLFGLIFNLKFLANFHRKTTYIYK
jgi:hypothetical protein